MNFQDLFNELFQELHCSQTELSKKTGVSRPAISRYLSGEREPASGSGQLENLCSGLAAVAADHEITNITFSNGKTIALTKDQIYSVFTHALAQKDAMYDLFVTNFDALISTYAINMKQLSGSFHCDVSYLYRVKSGERRPSNLQDFCETVGKYILQNHNSEENRKNFSLLANCKEADLKNREVYLQKICDFLIPAKQDLENIDIDSAQLQSFVKKLDAFDMDEHMRTIHFDDVKLCVPLYGILPKNYYGPEQMQKAELDFFKATALCKSKESVFMCSDMSVKDTNEDAEFDKKRMMGIALMLQMGLHLDIIQNINQSFHEMMLELETWIPFYMTGQVSPYYLPTASPDVYHNFNYVSGSLALTGEYIHGHQADGKYYVTGGKDEVIYYKKKANNLLSHAEPLMDIYRSRDKRKFHNFIKSTGTIHGKRHNILSSLPLYTIPEDLLIRMLGRSSFKETEQKQIISYVRFKKKINDAILKRSRIFDEVPLLSEEAFSKQPMYLSLSELFTDIRVPYTYEEYQEHIAACKAFAKKEKNYEFKLTGELLFRNIQIQILENRFVLISKANAPAIQFVIHHPKLVLAFQSFVPAATPDI